MAQQLVPEPAEAELGLRRRAVLAQRLGFFVPDEERPGLETLRYVGRGAGLRRLAARLEVKQPLAIRPDNDGGPLLPEEGKAGKSGSRKRAFAGAESQRLQSFKELAYGVWRREALDEKRRIKWNAVDLAQAANQPYELFPGQSLLQTLPSPGQILTRG